MLMQLPLACSLDSFLATAAIGLAGCPNTHNRRIILAFVACDTAATILRGSLPIEFTPLTVALVLFAALIIGSCARQPPAMYMVLPLLLSLDNLIVADPTVDLGALALMSGVFSGLAALFGFLVGRRAARMFSETAAKFATLALFSLALLH